MDFMESTLNNNSMINSADRIGKTSNKSDTYNDKRQGQLSDDKVSYQSIAKEVNETEGKAEAKKGNELPHEENSNKSPSSDAEEQTEFQEQKSNQVIPSVEVSNDQSDFNLKLKLKTGQYQEQADDTILAIDKSQILMQSDSETAEEIKLTATTDSELSRFQLAHLDKTTGLSQYSKTQYNQPSESMNPNNLVNVKVDNIILDNDLNKVGIKQIDITSEETKGLNIDGLQKLNDSDVSLNELLEHKDFNKLLSKDTEQSGMLPKNALESMNAAPKALTSEYTAGNIASNGSELPSIAANKVMTNNGLDIVSNNYNKIQPTDVKSTVSDIPEKVHMMMSRQDQSMRIMLEPPELGAMEIKINHHQGTTNISFHTQVLATKDVIESQMQDLRDSLNQEGIDLGDVNVHHQDANQEGENQSDMTYTTRFEDAEKEDVEVHQLQYIPNSRLDLFA